MFASGKSQSRSLIILFSTSLGILIGVLLLALLPAAANLSAAHHLTVCPAGPPGCGYGDIQSAVDGAADGDVIKIAAGRYSGVNNHGTLTQVVYISKSLTIIGGYNTDFAEPPDPEANVTIFDAEGQGRGLYIAEGAEVTASGLHFTGGDAEGLCGDPGCDGQTTDYGAGILVYSATFTLMNSWVYSNSAGHEGYFHVVGGGLGARHADIVVSDVDFYDNEASHGGGLALSGGRGLIEQASFSANKSTYGGGVWICHGAQAAINASTISHNYAWDGGGLYTCATETSIILNENLFDSNHAEALGGALAVFYGSSITSINNVLVHNNADGSGPGLYVAGGVSHLLHSTIAGNYGSNGGDGVGIYLNRGAIVLTNTILVSHTVGISVAEGSTATLEATLWGSGGSANDVDWLGAGTILIGAINLWEDPAFAPDGYHLTADSAAINNGVDAGVTTDIDGDSRPQDSLFDLGADEFVVVNGPDGGFVTGGGWIDSPAGAYKPDPDLTGKANFGFVSKYKKGEPSPMGNTEFQLHAGNLNFRSSSYERLVFTGKDYAMFKGEGTINGGLDTNGNPYKFTIWAGDDDPDTFRIRIWEEDSFGNETDIYDNGTDQAPGGGSIAIHTK